MWEVTMTERNHTSVKFAKENFTLHVNLNITGPKGSREMVHMNVSTVIKYFALEIVFCSTAKITVDEWGEGVILVEETFFALQSCPKWPDQLLWSVCQQTYCQTAQAKSLWWDKILMICFLESDLLMNKIWKGMTNPQFGKVLWNFHCLGWFVLL